MNTTELAKRQGVRVHVRGWASPAIPARCRQSSTRSPSAERTRADAFVARHATRQQAWRRRGVGGCSLLSPRPAHATSGRALGAARRRGAVPFFLRSKTAPRPALPGGGVVVSAADRGSCRSTGRPPDPRGQRKPTATSPAAAAPHPVHEIILVIRVVMEDGQPARAARPSAPDAPPSCQVECPQPALAGYSSSV